VDNPLYSCNITRCERHDIGLLLANSSCI